MTTRLEFRLQRIETAAQEASTEPHTEIILVGPETSADEVIRRVEAARRESRRFVVATHQVPEPEPPDPVEGGLPPTAA